MSHLFQDYRFGSEIDSLDNRSNGSLIAPNSDRPSLKENIYCPPLTKTALDKLNHGQVRKPTLNSTCLSYGSIPTTSINHSVSKPVAPSLTYPSIPLTIHTHMSFIDPLLNIASRVIDCRSSEPKNARISTDIVIGFGSISSALSQWLQSLVFSAPRDEARSLLLTTEEQEDTQFIRQPHICFENRSLFFFSSSSTLRIRLWKWIGNRWFECCMFVLLILQWILLSTDYSTTGPFLSTPSSLAFFCIQLVFTLEMTAKIIVYGFCFSTSPSFRFLHSCWKRQHRYSPINLSDSDEELEETSTPSASYHRDRLASFAANNVIRPSSVASITQDSIHSQTSNRTSTSTHSTDSVFTQVKHRPYCSQWANRMDLLALMAYWTHLSLGASWPPLSVIASVRLFRLLYLTEGTETLMDSIFASLDMLKNVMGFFVFFWVLFSLAALGLLPNAFTRQCALVNATKVTWVEPRRGCAGHWLDEFTRTGPFDWPTQTQLVYGGSDGYYCLPGQLCLQDTAHQPMYGHVSFQNMGYAMLNMFTIISTENWTDLLYIAQDSTSSWGAALFFASCIYVMTFILVPMFIAVITTSFSQGKHTFSSKQKISKDGPLQDWVAPAKTMQADRTKWQRIADRVLHSAWFQYVLNWMILMSAISMTWYRADLPRHQLHTLMTIQRVLNGLFLLEWVIRITSCVDKKQFWLNSKRNQLDTVIMLATVMDSLPILDSWHRLLFLFSVVRLYRMVYLFPGVLQLISDVVGDGRGIQNLTCFTFLVLFILSPTSIQLFGGRFEFVKEEPAMAFDTFYQAFLALFQIMTGENWVDILYDGMHSLEDTSVTFAAIFVSLMYFVVHYLVLNLFVAVIMENFDQSDEEIKRIQIKKHLQAKKSKPEYFQLDRLTRWVLPFSLYLERKALQLKQLPQHLVMHVSKHQFKQFYYMDTDHIDEPLQPTHPSSSPPASLLSSRNSISSSRRASIGSVHSLLEPPDEPTRYVDDYDAHVTRENKAVIMENLELFRSSMLFGPHSKMRTLCARLIQQPAYKALVIILICVGSGLALWTDAPHRQAYADWMKQVLEPVQAMLLVFYFVNFGIHVVTYGLIIMPEAFLRKFWNVLDLINLIVQTVLMSIGGEAVVGSLRVLRTLRILRVIYHVQTMRRIFLDLIYGLPKLVDVVLLNLLVFFSFAVYGCKVFAGQFAACNDDELERHACRYEYASEETLGILVPRVWQNPYDYSFDTFGNSFLHLFECASGEGWIRSLFTAMSVQRGQPPQFSWSYTAIVYSLYYVIFMFVASICFIQLFIGVFLEIFKQRNGISQLTSAQRQFQDLQRQLAVMKPSRRAFRPTHPVRAIFYDLVINKRGPFAQLMANVIMLNILVFATEHLYQSAWLTHLQNIMYSICIGFYVFEIVAKILGLGFSKWKSAVWNIYDFVLVCLVILTFVSKFYVGQNNLLEYIVVSCSKLFSVGITFRLAQRNESLDSLFKSIRRALPSIVSVSCVFGLVMICFGVLFQEAFGSTRYGPYGNDHANFRSLFNSILTLFRITTGEDWDALMHDFFVRPFSCVNNEDCGSPSCAIFLFSVFYIICTYIFVNLFTMIVIDNFSFTFDKRNQFNLITRSDLRNFKIAWSQEDPYATGFISVDQVHRFLSQLEGALSLRIYDEEHSIKNLIEASKRVDINPTHSTTIPVSGSRNSERKEQPYNFHQVNRQLATMNPHIIRLKKRRYAEVYQEVINTATRKGIRFQSMLTILAMQLVDVSTSLTFDALIQRSHTKGRIDRQLALENAQGLIRMMAARRRFLAYQQKKTKMPVQHKRNSLALVGQWLQVRPSLTGPSHLLSEQSGDGSVPQIVIDSADATSPSVESTGSSYYPSSQCTSKSNQSSVKPMDILRKVNSMPTLLPPFNNMPRDIMSYCYVEDDKIQHMDTRTANDILIHLNQSPWSDMLDELASTS